MPALAPSLVPSTPTTPTPAGPVCELIAALDGHHYDVRYVVALRVVHSALAELATVDGVDLLDVRDAIGEAAIEEALLRAEWAAPTDDGSFDRRVCSVVERRARASACAALSDAIRTAVASDVDSAAATHALRGVCDALSFVSFHRADVFAVVSRAAEVIDATELDALERERTATAKYDLAAAE